jgi:hypothetical protein
MGQPVLLDWLLIDAPLQNLRQDDASWRLRITVNGESFLVDQQTPLWLNGWRSGANSLLWELVDVRGEPLGSPFNSVVSELYVDDSKTSAPSNFSWLSGSLNSDVVSVLLGNSPPVTPAFQAQDESLPSEAVQPDDITPLLQDKDNVNDTDEMRLEENNVLPEPPLQEVLSGELPGNLGNGLEDAEPDSGSGPSGPAEPMSSTSDATALGLPDLEKPLPETLPIEPAKPEIPIGEDGSIGTSSERREQDRAAALMPDTVTRLEDLKEVPPDAGEKGDLDETIISPHSDISAHSEGFLARLGQGLRRRLGPS